MMKNLNIIKFYPYSITYGLPCSNDISGYDKGRGHRPTNERLMRLIAK